MLDLQTIVNTQYLPVTSTPRLLYVLVEVVPGEMPTRRVPVNLGLVVDVSYSMYVPTVSDGLFEKLYRLGYIKGERLRDGLPVWEVRDVPKDMLQDCPRSIKPVKEALREVLERLADEDYFSLVIFADRAELVIPVRPGTQRVKLLKPIDSLDEAGGADETRMAEGLRMSLEQVQSGGKAGKPSTQHVTRLLVLSDGMVLDKEETFNLAQQAARANVVISTLGIGTQFNEDLLIKIAESTGGHAHFAKDADEVPDFMMNELHRSQSIAYRNLELKLNVPQGVMLRRVHRIKPAITDLGAPQMVDRSANFPLGDLERAAPPSLLLELQVPPRPEGKYRLASMVLAYDDPWNETPPKVRRDLIVEYTSDEKLTAQLNSRVMNFVETVSAFKLQTRALQDLERGDTEAATVKLQAAATRLLDLGEDELARVAQQEALNLSQRGQMAAEGTKRLRYATRKLKG